jgi:hypothetical protein
MIVRCGARIQYLEADQQIQKNAYGHEAAENLPLHFSATVAQVRSCARGGNIGFSSFPAKSETADNAILKIKRAFSHA